MGYRRINKIVGYINEDIIEKYGLEEYIDKPIVQSLDLYAHIQKHLKDFESVDSFNHAVMSIPTIIDNPEVVYYDKNRKSLLYYKKIDENVCVVVKLNLRNNKDCYVSSIYPVNEYKIQKMIEKSYIKN